MIRALRDRMGCWLPRIKALVWAIFSTSTAWAYWGKVPDQLADIEALTPIPLWAVWAIAVALLTLGAIVPPKAGPRSKTAARWMRSAGIALAAGLLMMWALTYLDGQGRYWVTGKNYLMLAVLGLIGAWTIGKDEVT